MFYLWIQSKATIKSKKIFQKFRNIHQSESSQVGKSIWVIDFTGAENWVYFDSNGLIFNERKWWVIEKGETFWFSIEKKPEIWFSAPFV